MNLADHYMDQPNEISLETYAFCNAACTFCPYPTLDRKGTKMTDDLIDKIIDEMSEFTVPFAFSPFKVNEPLLDKRFINICRKVERNTYAHFRIFTNGAPLTPRKIEQIGTLTRVKHLWISLNSHIPDEYEALMSIPFEKTAKRIDYLHESDFPHPVVLSTVGYPNEDFRRYCYERWPYFESCAIQKSAWLGYTEAQAKVVPDHGCSRWFELSIMATGKVSHCCMHDGQDERYCIGDLNKQTILEVYNSHFWRERRELALSRRDLDDRSPCSKCTYEGTE